MNEKNESPELETSHLDDLSVILTNARMGDSDAETQLHQKFVDRLVRLASNRLNVRFRAKIDPEEIVQSVFASFFERYREGDFAFEDWNDLWALLVKITVRKCASKVEGFMTAKRDVGRERNGTVDSSRHSSFIVFSSEPTAEEVAIFNETFDQLMNQLAEPIQEIVLMRLQGMSNLEISQTINRSERTVYRSLNQVRELFESMDC